MPTSPYKLSFPCPDCGGMLTMCVKTGQGTCPLCLCTLTASLNITTQVKISKPKAISKLAWDKRAFRRDETSTKPMWQPIPQMAQQTG